MAYDPKKPINPRPPVPGPKPPIGGKKPEKLSRQSRAAEGMHYAGEPAPKGKLNPGAKTTAPASINKSKFGSAVSGWKEQERINKLSKSGVEGLHRLASQAVNDIKNPEFVAGGKLSKLQQAARKKALSDLAKKK